MERPPREQQEKEEFARDESRDPHHELNNPVGEPDPTEWPDPYEKRPDPRAPAGEGEDPPAPSPAPPSTSDPAPERNPDVEIHGHRGDHRGG